MVASFSGQNRTKIIVLAAFGFEGVFRFHMLATFTDSAGALHSRPTLEFFSLTFLFGSNLCFSAGVKARKKHVKLDNCVDRYWKTFHGFWVQDCVDITQALVKATYLRGEFLSRWDFPCLSYSNSPPLPTLTV